MTVDTGQSRTTTASIEIGQASDASPAQRWMRWIYRVLAGGFVAGLLLQFFVVGMALFVEGGRWDLHRPVGHTLGLFPLAMLALSFAARMSWPTRLLTTLPLGLVIMQQVTISIGDWAAALHPVNAVLLVGIGFHLFKRTADGPDSQKASDTGERN